MGQWQRIAKPGVMACVWSALRSALAHCHAVSACLPACLWLAGLPATVAGWLVYRGELVSWLVLSNVAPMERTWATKGNGRARLACLACWVGVVWLVVMGDGGSDG